MDYKFKRYNSHDDKEALAVQRVMKSGILSDFYGSKGDKFLGGKEVRRFEDAVCSHFGTKFAVSVNSWTSGLICIIGAIGIEPGDEVILPSWTMSACAAAVVKWGGVPIFADVCEDTFLINAATIGKLVTVKTRCIMAVDIFGQSCDVEGICRLVAGKNIIVISDTAQSPGATRHNRFAGTIAEIGGFSLNYHKHIHCGEGGVIVTNNEVLAKKCQLIRNHAEAVVDESMSTDQLKNMIGYNFRMGEIEAAIGYEQILKLNEATDRAVNVAHKLINIFEKFPFITPPKILEGNDHVYYVVGLKFDVNQLKVPLSQYCLELQKNGVPLNQGYINIHSMPGFKKLGNVQNENSGPDLNEKSFTLKNSEFLHKNSFAWIGTCVFDFDDNDFQLMRNAVDKLNSRLAF